MLKGMVGVRRSRGVWAVLAAVALACSVWLHWRLRDMGFDDTWIHLRIARNLLATGHAWFNGNERVMATSSPLWTLLLAALHLPQWPAALPVLEAVLLWAASVLAFLIAQRSLSGQTPWLRNAVATLAFCVTAVLLLSSSVGQMETPLAIVLLLGSWITALRGAPAALPLLALAAFTRLELLPVWLVVTAAAVLWSRRNWLPAAESLAIVAAIAAWTQVQFHVLLPNSMRAKQISYDFTLAQTAHQFFGLRLRDVGIGLLFVGLLATTLVTALRSRNGRGVWRPLLPALAACCGALVIAEYIARRTAVFEWYRPLYLLPLALGVLLLVPRATRPALRLAVVAAQALVLLWLIAEPARALPRMLHAAAEPTVAVKSKYDGGDSARVQEYLEVGRVLARTCPQGRVLASEIGGLGWAFPGQLLDGFGIASPAALRWQPLRSGAPKGGIPAGFLLYAQPDVVVSYTVMSYELLDTPAVAARYDLLLLPTSPRSHRGGLLDIAWRSSTHLNVWLRRDSPCDTDAVKQALRAQIE